MLLSDEGSILGDDFGWCKAAFGVFLSRVVVWDKNYPLSGVERLVKCLLDWRLEMGSTFLYNNIILVSREGGGIEPTHSLTD
jgi:hypothetical protein